MFIAPKEGAVARGIATASLLRCVVAMAIDTGNLRVEVDVKNKGEFRAVRRLVQTATPDNIVQEGCAVYMKFSDEIKYRIRDAGEYRGKHCVKLIQIL